MKSFDAGPEAQVLARKESFAASFGRRINDAANRLSEALEHHKPLVLGVFSIAFFVLTLYRASRKLFWFDELFTVYLSRLPDMRSVWQAVTHGTDFNPPLLYLFTRISEHALGEGQVAARLPETLGFWIFCLCLFRFVSLRLSVLSASVSMLFPLVTGAYFYAYEARAHGLVLGFCGVALVSWQAAADRETHRAWWLFALAGSLAGALLTHSYAFLIFAPIALGELTRATSLKRLDWPVWVAIAVSSLAVLASIPLVKGAVSEVGSLNFFAPSLGKFVALYVSLLRPAAKVLIGWALLTCMVLIFRWRTERVEHEAGFRAYELVALGAFVAVPVLLYAVTKLVGTPFMSRYGISAVAGVACLLGASVWKKPVVAIGTLALLAGQLGVSAFHFASFDLAEPVSGYGISTRIRDFDERYEWMAAHKTLPIVLIDDLDFIPTAFYAPPSVASRLVYLMTPGITDINGKEAARLRACCNSEPPVAEPADFLASHEAFLAFGGPRSVAWLDDFAKAGATITKERANQDHFLALVVFPKKIAEESSR